MSSARNHAKRSHRSEQFKKSAFGASMRRGYASGRTYSQQQSAIKRFFSKIFGRKKEVRASDNNNDN